jgi:tRNA 2-thiouridine synthesizing protein A
MSHHLIDAKRLLCPLPVIRLQQTINRVEIGDTIEIVCRDPGVLQDIPAWCRVHGHQCLEVKHIELDIQLLIKKS